LLAVDWRTDHMVTKVMHEDAIDRAGIASTYRTLEQDAEETLRRDGIPADRVRLVREADVRYAGQSMEVRVQAPAGPVGREFLADLFAAFHAAHNKTFGYHYAGEQKVELVNLRVSGFGLIDRPRLPHLPTGEQAPPPGKAARPVYFDGAFRDTVIYERTSLSAGCRLRGPVVIEEFGSTTVVFPRQTVTVDPFGVLIIRREVEA
jgi:N-methylhydantoinase A